MALAPFFGRGNRNNNIWDPFSFPSGFFDPSDALLDRNVAHEIVGSGTKVDWVESPEAHTFKADLPGLKREEIKVDVRDGRTLSISGERNKEEVKETDSWRCVERSSGKFSRQFRLPENANVNAVTAKVENGVLTVTVPKQKSDVPRVRSIDIA